MNPTINARRLFVVLLDMLAILAAYYLAFLLRFDFRIDSEAIPIMLKSMPMVLTIYIALLRLRSIAVLLLASRPAEHRQGGRPATVPPAPSSFHALPRIRERSWSCTQS